MNDKYDDIISKLRETQPVPTSSDKLTYSIMSNLEKKRPEKKQYITLNVSDRQWSVINGIRIIMSSAAVLLIGYLVFQQWETNQKLQVLQKAILLGPNNFDNEQNSINYFEKAYNELKLTHASYIEENPKIEKLMIERKSLNYLLNQIRELKKENESFREILEKKYKSKNIKQ